MFCLVAFLLLIPGFFSDKFFADLGALYVFGFLLSFGIAQAAILSLRVRKAELPRPFKLGGNIKVKGRELPITAILGLIGTSAIWLVVVITQPYSRWTGIAWMVIGLIIYYLYRRKQRASLAPSEDESVKSD